MGNKQILYGSLIMVTLSLGILFVIVTVYVSYNYPVDFPVFYGAARNVLKGLSIYTDYGVHHLPFWYFPWVSWVFLPLAVLSSRLAWIIYIILSFMVAFLSIHALANYYEHFSSFDRLYMFSMLLWIGWHDYAVGQISFFLLGVAVLSMLLAGRNQSILAGLVIPLLLMKPHLFIIFIPLLVWLGGKKTLIAGTLVTLSLLMIETLITPPWIRQWLGLLALGPGRVDVNPFFKFTTFPTLLGFSQNYLGTANLPFTIGLVIIAAFVVVRFRSLSKIPLLSIALAASLFCAPRSYAYDLVLLIPALVWLSEKGSVWSALLWLVCALIPILAHFSAGSYLVTLLVFSLCIVKAVNLEKQAGLARSFFGRRLYPVG
jgi:hypothetical protein